MSVTGFAPAGAGGFGSYHAQAYQRHPAAVCDRNPERALDGIASFADAVTAGTPILAGGDDGAETTRVIGATDESARAGHPVHLTRNPPAGTT